MDNLKYENDNERIVEVLEQLSQIGGVSRLSKRPYNSLKRCRVQTCANTKKALDTLGKATTLITKEKRT